MARIYLQATIQKLDYFPPTPKRLLHSPPISVIIPCYNSCETVLVLLSSLNQQTVTDFEVILINDGSEDNLINVLDPTEYKYNLVIFSQTNKGRSIARNKGAELSKSPFLLFLDADINIPQDHLQKGIELRNKFPKKILSGPAIENPLENTEFGKYKAFISQTWISEHSMTALTSANLFIDKFTFDKLNGFDQSLTDAEDFDFKIRALQENIEIHFSLELKVEHNAFYSCVEYITRQREYRKAHTALRLMRKDSVSYDKYLEFHPKLPASKKLIYSLISPKLTSLIDKGFFTFLPQKIRYPFYSRVVAALSVYFPEKPLPKPPSI